MEKKKSIRERKRGKEGRKQGKGGRGRTGEEGGRKEVKRWDKNREIRIKGRGIRR